MLFLQVFKNCLTASQSWYFRQNTPSEISAVSNSEQEKEKSSLILTTAGEAQRMLAREELRKIIEARKRENSPSDSKWRNRIGSFVSNLVKDVTLQTLREAERKAREELRAAKAGEKLEAYHRTQVRAAQAAIFAKAQGLLEREEEAMYETILTKLDDTPERLIKEALKEAIKEALNEQANQSTEPQIIPRIINKFEEKLNALIEQTDGEIKKALKTIKKQGLSSNLAELLKTFNLDTTEPSTTTEQEKQEQNSHSQGLEQLDEMIDSLAIKIAIQKGKDTGVMEDGQHWLEKIATRSGHPAAAFAIGVTAAGLRWGLQYFGWLNLATTGAVGAGVGALRGYLQSREQFKRALQQQAYGNLVAPNNPPSEQVSTSGNGQQSVQNQSGQISLLGLLKEQSAKAVSWAAKLNAELNTARVEYEMVSAEAIVDDIELVAGQIQGVAGQIPALNPQDLDQFLELVSGIDSQIRAILSHWREGNPTMKINLTPEKAQNLGIEKFDQLKQLPPDLAYRTILYAIQARWLSLQPEIQSKVEKIRSVGNHRAGTEAVEARINELQQNISNAYGQDRVRRWKKIGADAILGATAAGAGFEVGQGFRHFIDWLRAIDWRPQKLLEMLGKIFEPPVASAAESHHYDSYQFTTNGILNREPVGNVILDAQGSPSSPFHKAPKPGAGEAGLEQWNQSSLSGHGPVGSGSVSNLTSAENIAETPIPDLKELLQNPDWRSRRLNIAGFLGQLAKEDQNLIKMLTTNNGELDKEKVTALAEALTNADNQTEFNKILERFQNNPEGEFANWLAVVRGEGRYGPISDSQQQLLLAKFMQANGMTVPEELKEILQVAQAAQALNTQKNIKELANAIEGAIGPKFDPGEWVIARAAVAEALSTQPDLAVIIQNDPKRATALAEAIVRAYKQGGGLQQKGLQRIEATLADLASNPDGFFTKQIKMIDGRVSEETQEGLLKLMMTDNVPSSSTLPTLEPRGGTLGQIRFYEANVLFDQAVNQAPSPTYYDLPPGTGSEPGIVYRETITNDLQTLFDSSGKIPKGKYIPFDPTNLPDISQTEATTVLHLDLSKTSMAEAIDGLNKIAGQTDKPIVLAVGPNGPNAGIEFVTDLGRQIGQYENLREAMKQGRIVLAFVQSELINTDTGKDTGKIVITDPGGHIDFDTAIRALGKRPERNWFYTEMPDDIPDVQQNTGILELLGNIKTRDNLSSEIQILSIEKGVGPRIRPVSEIFADSINKKLTELAQNAGVNLGSDEVNIFTNGVKIDESAVKKFLESFSDPNRLKQLSDEDLTLLATLIAGSINNRDLNAILKNNPNSAIAAIIREFMDREGPNWGNILKGLGVLTAIGVGITLAVKAIRYLRSRRQAGGAGPGSPANAEIQRIEGEATTIINGFVGELQSNSLNTQELQDNWRTIERELNTLSQQGLPRVQSEIDYLIERIKHRVADSQITGNLNLTTELTDLSIMVYDITNLLEIGSGWDTGFHNTNIIAVFKAILFEAYNRGINSQNQAIEAGLSELENNLQNNQNNEIAPDMVGNNDVTAINDLILNDQVGLSQSERDLWNQLIQNSQQNPQAIIGSLISQNNQQIVRSIAAKIVVALETNRNWNPNERQNNLKAVAKVLAYMVQEIQRTLRDAPNIIGGFAQELASNINNLNTQVLQNNWTTIIDALNTLSQQAQGQGQGQNPGQSSGQVVINNLIGRIQRRVADSQATGNLDLTPELPELSEMVYRTTNLLESRSGWDTGFHDTNIIAVFRAILYEAYSRERDSQNQAIEAGLTELENNGLAQSVTNDHPIILSLISRSQNNNAPIVISQHESSTLHQLDQQLQPLAQPTPSNPQDIIQTLNSDPDLKDTYRRVVARIVVELETNRNWNPDAHEDNLKAVAQVLAYMIARSEI